MPCYSPLQGYKSIEVTEKGKRKFTFSSKEGFVDMPMTIACGQCIGCRLERSRQWAIRISHEASLYDDNCFITLTYSNEYLPKDMSLDVSHFQKFMKRLRKRVDSRVRFFHCGEYGSRYGRPHYHAILFNFDFPDKKLWKEENGQKLYRSALLEELWPYGHSSVGTVTFQSAAYVARYILKKVSGPAAEAHYAGRKPEYTTMSRRSGVGKEWFDRFLSDVFPRDEIIMNNRKMRPPKYYDSLYELYEPEDYERVKGLRRKVSVKFVDNNTRERLDVRRKVKERQLERLHRNVDKEL